MGDKTADIGGFIRHKWNVVLNEVRYRFAFRSRLHDFMGRLASRIVFSQDYRERACRQEFFYNAFKALAFNGIEGDYAEFGCCGGMTFGLAHQEAVRHGHKARLWAFDSFQGLPPSGDEKDAHVKWVAGNMKTSLDQFHKICASNRIPKDRYTVVSGFYNETLPKMMAEDAPSNLALAYVDCDLYSSTRTVLEFLGPRLKHGMIIAFDDYFCWSESNVSGEKAAMMEYFNANSRWALVPYMRFGWHGQSFVVEKKTAGN